MMIGLGTDFWGNALFVFQKTLYCWNRSTYHKHKSFFLLLATFLGGFLAYLFNYEGYLAEKGYQLKTWTNWSKTLHDIEQALVL